MKVKNSQWLIRTSKGKIQGPFATREVMFKIKSGELEGTEEICNHPGGRWRPITHNTDFYDYLLACLSENSENIDDDETNWDIDPETLTLKNFSLEPSDDLRKSEQKSSEPLDLPSPNKTKEDVNKTNSVKKSITKSDDKQISSQEKKPTKKPSKKKLKTKPKTNKRKAEKQKKSFFSPVSLGLTLIICCLVGFFLFNGPKKSVPKVKILIPKNNQTLPPEAVRSIAREATEYFLQDDVQGYIQAQIKIVQVLEADPSYEELYSLLCVSHYNLWPHSDQSEVTIKKIKKFSQMAKQYDSSKLNYANCHAAFLILQKQSDKASRYIDNIIERYANTDTPPTIPYYFKSQILKNDQMYEALKDSAGLLELAWPQWLAGAYLSGVAMFHLDEGLAAIEKFKLLLNQNPRNKKALIYIGMIRQKFYKEFKKSIESIEVALNIKERIDDFILGQAYFYLAQSFLNLNDAHGAKKNILKAYKYNPVDVEIENFYISLFGEQGKATLSEQSYLLKGDQFRREGDCNAAQAYYREAIQVNPKNSEAVIKSGQCLWELGLSEDAISVLLKLVQVSPGAIDVVVALAKIYRELYQFKLAQDLLTKTHNHVKGHHKIYKEFASLELARRNPLSAIKYADKSLSRYDDDVEALMIKIKAQILLSKYQEAYSIALKAMELEPTSVDVKFIYAETYYYVHGIDATVRYLNKLIGLYSTEKKYRLALAQAFFKDEQYTLAENVFKQLIEIDPKFKPALMGLARCYKSQRRLNLSKQILLKAASLNAIDVEPLVELGLLYLESKAYQRALKQFKRVAGINADFPKVSYYLGKTHFLMGDYKLAIKWASQEKQNNPQEVDAYLLAGEVYEKQGLYQFCSREYQQALQYREFGAHIYLQISRCYSKSGALDVAMNMLERARAKDSGLSAVYRELGSIYELKGNPDKAIWAYEYYLSLSPQAVDASQVMNKLNSLR